MTLFGLRILKTVSSIAILSLSAHFFGVSVERDIWILASTCILVLDLAIWGPVNETFRTKFIFLKEQQGEAVALQKATSLISVTAVVSLAIGMIILIYPQLLARVIAPGYYHTHLPVLNFMIRVIVPSFLINQVIQLIIGVLNAYHSFYMPEIAGLISSVLNIIILVVLVPFFGIYSLVFAYYVSLLVLFILAILQVRKLKIPIKLSYFRKLTLTDTWPFFLFALPFFLPYFAGQINQVGEKSIANLLGTGTVSLIDYARKFIDIPVNALSSVLLTILLPVLSAHFSTGQLDKFVSEFKRVLQLGLLALTFIMGVLILNATSIVSIIYGSHKISGRELGIIAQLVQLYSLAAFSIFLYLINGIALISLNKGKYYAFYGVVAQILMLAMNLFLYQRLNVYVFPVSLFLSHVIASVFLFVKLPVGRREMGKSIIRYSLLLTITILIPLALGYFITVVDSPYQSIIINCALLLFFGIALIFMLRIEERSILLKFIRRTKPASA